MSDTCPRASLVSTARLRRWLQLVGLAAGVFGLLSGLSSCSRGRVPSADVPGESGTASPGAAATTQARNNMLSALATEQLDAELQFSPTTATWLGDHTSDDRLDDVSIEAVFREIARLGSLQERLRRLRETWDAANPPSPAAATTTTGTPSPEPTAATNSAANTARDAVDTLQQYLPQGLAEKPSDVEAKRLELILLQARIEARRFELLEWRAHERNPLHYVNLIAFGLDGLLGPQLASTTGLRALRGRLAQVPTVCREAQRNLKNPPELWTKRAVDVAQMTRDFLAVVLPRILANLNTATVDPKLMEEVGQRREEAQRAIEELITWMNRDLTPRSKGDWTLPRPRLQARLRALELLDVPLELVQQVAEHEHQETQRKLEDLARSMTGLSSGSTSRAINEAVRSTEDDHPKPEELLQSIELALDKAYESVQLARLLPPLTQRPRVTEMPAYRFGLLQPSFPAQLESEREAQLWVDPIDASWKDKKRITDHLRLLNRTQVAQTIAREVMPGRYAQQQLLRQRAKGLSPLRQRTRSLAFAEGWADYAQQLQVPGLVIGPPTATAPPTGTAEKLQLLNLRHQLLRLGRLLAVLTLHAPVGVTTSPSARFEEAVRFFAEECFLDDYTARREAERATYDPLSALSALGRLQLLQLRADYQTEHPGPLDLAHFHQLLLTQGELPVVALRRLLLAKVSPSLSPPPAPPPTDPSDSESR